LAPLCCGERVNAMPRRPAITLVEVLVAIFVMGIGMLAVLTLFPLGALTMAQAIRDNRAGHIGATAASMLDSYFLLQPDGTYAPPAKDFYLNQLYAEPPGAPPADPNGPSYPVFLDPLGLRRLPGSNNNVAGLPQVPRGIPWSLAAAPLGGIYNWFSLLDDMNFTEDGVPDTSTGEIERDGRFTWAYMLRRPKTSDPSVVEVSVIVFNRRSLATVAETDYGANFDPASRTVRVYQAVGKEFPP